MSSQAAQTLPSELTQTAYDFLRAFAVDEDFTSNVTQAFGELFDAQKVEDLRQQWAASDFKELPTIEIRSAADINGAKGAFSKDTSTIYLSKEFINQNAFDPQAIITVLLEEIGHFVDARINQFDALGDEGAIFTALVQGVQLGETELQAFRTENDAATITLNGQVVQIEQAETYTGTNLDQVSQGLNKLLTPLQDAIDTVVFANNLPLVGKQLQNVTNPAVDFITDLRDTALNKLGEVSGPLTSTSIRQALFDALGQNGLNWLKDSDDSGNEINLSDIKVNETANALKFNFRLGRTPSVIDTPLGFDIGLPGLGLTVDGDIKADLGFDFDVGFGVNTTDGFYFDTGAGNELTINLNTSIPDLKATGELGFLQLDITDEDRDTNQNNSGVDVDGDGVKPTQLNGTFAVNLKDANDALTLAELNSGVTSDDLIDATLNGSADVNLNLVTSLGVKGLPSVGTDLQLNWGFENANLDPSQPQSFGNAPTVAFKNVKLNLGSFFNDFVNPIFQEVKEVTGTFPIKQIVDVLQKKLPVLDDLGSSFLDVTGSTTGGKDGKVTLLDIVKLKQPDAPVEFIGAVSSFTDLVNKIPTGTSDIFIDLGSFELGSANVRDPSFVLSDPTQAAPTNIETAADVVTQLQNFVNDGNSQAIKAKNFFDAPNNTTDVASATGLQFPLLNEPTQAFKLLLNQPVDLFKYNLPELSFGTGFDQFFPIFGPLGALIEGNLNAKIKLDFGYDITGLQQFSKSNNTADIFNGFYISTPPADPNEAGGYAPVAKLSAGLSAYGALDVVIASAGVGGGILGELKLYLNDVTPDGKVHIDEFDPSCIFDPVTGKLTAGLDAFVRFGFGPFSYTKRFDIAKETLLSFEIGCTGPDDTLKNYGLATDIGGGVLRLNMGRNASDRVIDGTPGTDVDEVFTVQLPSESTNSPTVNVSAFGVTRPYVNVGKIVADGGVQDDAIAIGDTVLTPTALTGGEGRDQLYGGGDDDTLEGNANNDGIYGSKGNDNLSGGDGDDLLLGAAGADTFNGGAGNDTTSYKDSPAAVTISPEANSFVGSGGDAQGDRLTSIEHIEGSNYNDSLTGDDLQNIFEGLGGNDFLKGGGGDDILLGGSGGADTLDGGSGKDWTGYVTSPTGIYIYLETGQASSGDAQGDVLISIEDVKGSIYNDFLTGNDSDNFLDGFFGDDTVIGGSGADELDGSNGNDWASYNTSPDGVNVSLKTGQGSGGDSAGDELLFTKDRDGNSTAYNSIANLEGSAYNDVLEGDIGNNILKGLDRDDAVRGDGGNDTLIGGAGADNFDGGTESDWADYSDSLDFVSVNLASGTGANADAAGDTFVQIDGFSTVENLLGSNNGDTLVGDKGNNQLAPGLSRGGVDDVDGGSGYFTPNTSPPGSFGNSQFIPDDDVLILDYSLGDTGSGMYSYVVRNEGGRPTEVDDNVPGNNSGVAYRYNADSEQSLDSVTFKNFERYQITGTSKDDNLNGGDDSDTLSGSGGNDALAGYRGNDFLVGEDGNDLLRGTNDINYGAGEFPNFPKDIDTLTGGAGADKFILGDASSIYYTNAATSDYALITDFNPNQGDIIQLRDYSESRYFVKPSPSGLPTGTAIYFGFQNEVTDLIAIVQGAVDLNLRGKYFKFDSSPQEIDYGDCNCTLPESPPPLY